MNFRTSEIGLSFLYQVEIWGADRNSRDNLLYLTHEREVIPDDNSRTITVGRTIRNSRLNEDKSGRDELYAKVKLRPNAEHAQIESAVFTARF